MGLLWRRPLVDDPNFRYYPTSYFTTFFAPSRLYLKCSMQLWYSRIRRGITTTVERKGARTSSGVGTAEEARKTPHRCRCMAYLMPTGTMFILISFFFFFLSTEGSSLAQRENVLAAFTDGAALIFFFVFSEIPRLNISRGDLKSAWHRHGLPRIWNAHFPSFSGSLLAVVVMVVVLEVLDKVKTASEIV